MARKTIAERKALKTEQLRQLKEELQRLEAKAAERLGRLAVRAGLADVDADDSTLLFELEALASRFRASTGSASATNHGASP